MRYEYQLSILQDFLQLFIPEYCLWVVSNVYSFQNMKFIKNNRNAILAPPFSEWQETKKIKGRRKEIREIIDIFTRSTLFSILFLDLNKSRIWLLLKYWCLTLDSNSWLDIIFFRENVSAELFSIFDVRNWHLNTIWVHQSSVSFLNWFFFFQNSWKN